MLLFQSCIAHSPRSPLLGVCCRKHYGNRYGGRRSFNGAIWWTDVFKFVNTTLVRTHTHAHVRLRVRTHASTQICDDQKAPANINGQLHKASRLHAGSGAVVIQNFCGLCSLLEADWSQINQKFVMIGWLTEDGGILCHADHGLGCTEDVFVALTNCGKTVNDLIEFLDSPNLLLWLVSSGTFVHNMDYCCYI